MSMRERAAALSGAADAPPRPDRARPLAAPPVARDDDGAAGLVAPAPARPAPPSDDPIPNPTYGLDYWVLGVAAALPAFLCALALLAAAGRLPRLPQVPVGLALGAVLVLLAVGAVGAHACDYPAWTQPGVGLLPTLALLVPAAVLRGQVVARVNGDPDRMAAIPLAGTWLLLATAAIVCALVAVVVGRHAPSYSGMALLPAPLLLTWLLLLAPPFDEAAVLDALGSALALAALAAFLGWLVPTNWRAAAPAVALGVQFTLVWALRLTPPPFAGALRPLVALDLALYAGLVIAVLFVPYCAAWLRHRGWRAVDRLFG